MAQEFSDYFDTARDPAYVGSGAMVVKSDVFHSVGGFDENMPVGEDMDFYFKVGTTSAFVRVLAPVTLAYRRHAGNVSRNIGALYSDADVMIGRESEGSYCGVSV